MKKLFSLFVIFLILLTTGCSKVKLKEQFVEGLFFGVYENQEYYFEVKSITKKEYKNADGKNVLKSETNDPPYFQCVLYYFDDENNKQTIDFYNIKKLSWYSCHCYSLMYNQRENGIWTHYHLYPRFDPSETIKDINYDEVTSLSELKNYYAIEYWVKYEDAPYDNLCYIKMVRLYSYDDIRKCPNLDVHSE